MTYILRNLYYIYIYIYIYINIITGVSLEFHVAGIRNVAGGSLAGDVPGLEMCGILVANATMLSHLLPGFSCGSKHLLLP